MHTANRHKKPWPWGQSPSAYTRIAALLLAALLFTAGCGNNQQNQNPPAGTQAPAAEPASIFPKTGALTGAYVDFGEGEDDVTLEAIDNFENMVGKHQAVIASSSFWGEQNFPLKNVEIISRHSTIPLIFWSPWDKPYAENRPPDRFSLNSILAGQWDGYIDQWADAARGFAKPLMVAWGLEMNGTWFPWSGFYYGGGLPLHEQSQPGTFAGPETYKQAYRYVVSRVKARGASNILWVFHINNATYPDEPWNMVSQYYPGPEVVDILGFSAYGKIVPEMSWGSPEDVMDRAYQELCELDPDKPLIAAEWGVGEYPKAGNKAAWITSAFAAFRNKYPRIKAAVFWHERWQNQDESYSNLRVNSSPEALQAYREAVADPYWVGGR